MSNHAWTLLGLFLVVLLLTVKPLGIYIANVMEGRFRLAGKIESPIYRLCGIRQDEEMGWLKYAFAILLFNFIGVLAVYVLQRLQADLPLNPQAFAQYQPGFCLQHGPEFVTNTNWQGYGGESTMSYLTQMLALAVQNFLSAATGIVVVIALIRGFARHSAKTVGNAWVDLTRITLHVLAADFDRLRGLPDQSGRHPEFRRLQGCDDAGSDRLRESEGRCRRPAAQGRQRRRHHRTGRKRKPRRWPWARSPRRKRSRCWAPTVAAS